MTTLSETQFETYAQRLHELGGTDLLFTVDAPVQARVDGKMRAIAEKPLRADEIEVLISDSLPAELLARFHQDKEVDFSVDWPGTARFRGNAFRQRGAPAISLRSIPLQIPTFDELGIPERVRQLAQLSQGFVLVTGPTGAGKSTTIASLLDRINAERACHILTIEDPIEYIHNHQKAIVSQREIGQDTESFQRALRSVLREDPDVLLIGEMRDPESIATALTIAETGHLVFSTLHTNDASQALDRIVDVFPAERQQQVRVQLSSSLSGIVAQRLLPKVGGGLVAAFEVLVATPAVRNLVKEGKTNQIRNVIMTGQDSGMQTLESSLSALVEAGSISHDDALARAAYPKEVKQPAEGVKPPA